MKIVQTFWSGGKNPLEDSFGWLKPEYNLMSWALSCLSLKKHYDEVVLYTDSIGYDIFINKLKLPYSDVVVQYDNLKCPQSLWAYPKLLTYSVQERPFIHVDGDVYLSKKFEPKIEFADLVAQNKERGTAYYKNMMMPIYKNPAIKIPDFLSQEVKKDSISSYNAGIIGGNDLSLIKQYCDAAFRFIQDNNLHKKDGMYINHNILFEQILFYALIAQSPEKKVSPVLNLEINDNGYTYQQFCDFTRHENGAEFMHIIGGHKRAKKICNLLNITLLKHHPEYFFRITNLFSENHKRIYGKQKAHTTFAPLREKIKIEKKEDRKFNNFLDSLSIKWNNIASEELFRLSNLTCNYFNFFKKTEEEQLTTVLRVNPYLEIYESSREMVFESRQTIKGLIDQDFYTDNFDMACIPDVLFDGEKIILIDDLWFNIIVALRGEKTLKELIKILENNFKTLGLNENSNSLKKTILNRLEYLFYNKLIYIKD